MPVVLGLDLGTTTITALALDAARGDVRAAVTAPNSAAIPAPPGRAESDLTAIGRVACGCLRDLAERLGPGADLVGLGITGQQHGVALVDRRLQPPGPVLRRPGPP